MTKSKEVGKKSKEVGKKSKEVDKKEKRINQTKHQLAMTNPKVIEALAALRARWSDLSRLQRGEELNVLIGLHCSVGKIAKELGKSATTLSRYIDLANPREDWITTVENAWAEDPQEQSARSADQNPCHLPPKIPVKRIVEPVIKETRAAQNHVQTTAVPQTKKIASPLSTKFEEPPVLIGATSGQENQAGEAPKKRSMLDSYRSGTFEGGIRRFEPIVEPMSPRPLYDARSIKRQGKQ